MGTFLGRVVMASEAQGEVIRFPDDTGRTLPEVVQALPSGATLELAPGRFSGPLVISRPMTLRGAGDLSRISGGGRSPVIVVRVPYEGRVVLDSMLLDEGLADSGAGVFIEAGRVRLHNVHIQRCRSEKGSGGGIHITGGELEAERLRAHDLAADRGGAVCASGRAFVRIMDSEIRKSEARLGGAILVEDAARVSIEALTIAKVRASTSSGGQAIWVGGTRSMRPVLSLRRVRLEDAPMGMPLVVDTNHPGEVTLSGCDMPRMVLAAHGVIDAGTNRWR